ncbi:COG1216 Predicted glycosyltransferases [Paracoccaceae bacterium]|jgi:N-acetylglucosaminyl-diphospho-decaprenol L-rhamnosyltransferase
MPQQVSAAEQVTIVTVSYNSLTVLPQMLASVPEEAKVVVVDNASDDRVALQALCDQHGAACQLNDCNMGFGTACNQGAAVATTPFVLFLNPDATLMPDTLDQLVAAAARYPKASAMNPRIAAPNGSAFFHRATRLLPREEHMPRGWPEKDREVTLLSGAALFVRRSDFEAVGGFDPKIFLYHEDDDLSIRLRKERGPILFIRDALVQHQAGSSTPRRPQVAALKAYHRARSAVYATRKHGRSAPFVHALLMAIAGLIAPDMLWSSRRRAKNWAFLKGVLSTLRDGGAA